MTDQRKSPWRSAVNGTGAKPWFVWKPKDPAHPVGLMIVLSDRRGNYRRFKTKVAADRAAAKHNVDGT